MCITTLTPNQIIIIKIKKIKKEWMKNIESNYVKDVAKPIYGYPEIRSEYTGEHTRQISTAFNHQLCNY